MLPLKTVQEVQRLLAKKCHSQRQIAQLTGVSRGTVHAIASGKRGMHGREPAAQAELDEPTPVRCRGCGARVYLPCVLCQARAFNNQCESPKQLQPPSPKRVA
jgi:hypothetical protein